MAQNPDYEGPRGSVLRQKANEFAKERSRLLDFATELREKRDHKTANQMVEQAKVMGTNMKAANEEAARAIFQYNNAEKGYGDDFIDLHGLQVSEAMEYLDARIQSLARTTPSSDFTSLVITVGAGHHSGPGGPRVKFATQDFLDRQGIPFTEANPGRLQARIRGTRHSSTDGTTELQAPTSEPTGVSQKKESMSWCCAC